MEEKHKMEGITNKLSTEIPSAYDWKETDGLDGMCKKFTDYIAMKESCIPEFFSKDGEATNIKQMYQIIRSGDYNESATVDTVDVNMATHIYEEYSQGMVQFVNEVLELTESVNTDYEGKITKAKENDQLFIESIFGGTNNQSKDESIKEAVQTIETLIDIMPKLKSYKTQCHTMVESAKEKGKENDPLTISSFALLFESVARYCDNAISNIMTTYNGITNSIKPESKEVQPEITKGISHYTIF